MYCVIVVGKYVHAAVLCKEMALLREEFYAHVRHTFGNQVYNELRSGSDERKLQTFIGKRVLALLNLNIQKHSQNGHLLRVNVYAFCLA